MRKGQAEMVGLMVIVILLLFIGLIFLKFYLLQPSFSPVASRQSIEAGNLLNALTHVSFQGNTFSVAVQLCANDQNTCQLLEQDLTSFFQTVLLPQQHYQFTLSTEGTPLLALGLCTEGIARSSGFLESNTFYDLSLKLC